MIYVYTLLGFVIFFLLLAVGVIFRRKPLLGSCGGLRSFGGHRSPCEICGAPPEEPNRCQQKCRAGASRDDKVRHCSQFNM